MCGASIFARPGEPFATVLTLSAAHLFSLQEKRWAALFFGLKIIDKKRFFANTGGVMPLLHEKQRG